jgi:transaldolase
VSEPDELHAPLRRMTMLTPTRFFNDSCTMAELDYAVRRGANGATSNPVISLAALRADATLWMPHLKYLVQTHQAASEYQIAWELYKDVARAAAAQLLPTFEANHQQFGRVSVQTDPTLFNNTQAMLSQAKELASLAPNMQVKVPATEAGIAMIEEATFAGVSLNVTVSFTVPQVVAIAHAIERGLARRDTAGLDSSRMAPVATIMVGRLDDWLKVVVARDSLDVPIEVLGWAGIAVAKRAYEILQRSGLRTKLLIAAYRHLGHWTEFVGGDVVLTMPWEWQVMANRSGIEPGLNINRQVDFEIVSVLKSIPDFVRAYEPEGMRVAEFGTYGASVRTLRSFCVAWHEFISVVRDEMLPDPDVKRTDVLV